MPTVSEAAIVRCRGNSGYAVGVRPIDRIRKAAKTDLATKRVVTRRMLRRIRRPSPTILGTAAKSPDTRTTSAIDREYRRKYARFDDSYVTPMTALAAQDATLSIRPR